MQSKTVKYSSVTPQDLGGGVTRRVLAYLPDEMMVEVHFDAGGVGAPHRHTHTQCTYVRDGEFTFTVEGETFEVVSGDTLAFAPNEEHGCVCRKCGTLIDVFTPMRKDFVK